MHTQINVSTPEEVFIPPQKGFFPAAAEQQQTATATARPVAAQWKHNRRQQATAAQRGRWWRGGSRSEHKSLGLRAWGCGCGEAKENEINTAKRLLKIGFAPVDLLYSESLTKSYQKLLRAPGPPKRPVLAHLGPIPLFPWANKTTKADKHPPNGH